MFVRKLAEPLTKVLVPALWTRGLSSVSPVLTQSKDINKNMTIVHHTTHSEQHRPLVLLFGWLLARPEHLKKFTEFYLDIGCDVLSIKIFLNQLLRPKKVQSLMRNVLDLCHEGHRQHQPIITHGLSVGGYLYGEVLNNMLDYGDKYGDFGQRIYGQIFDSPVDFYGIPSGIAKAVTNDPTKERKIESSLEWYLEKFESITKDYIRSSETFLKNDLKTPSLFLYSQSDPVCNPAQIEHIANKWRSSGIETETVFWETAPHVTSFKMYPQEYKYFVRDFLWRTGVPGHRMSKKEHPNFDANDVDLQANRVASAV